MCFSPVWSIRYLGVLGVSVAQITIDPPVNVSAVEGTNLTITCNDEVNTDNEFILHENGLRLTGGNSPPSERMGMGRVFQLPVDRAKNGNTYNCEGVIATMMSSVITLTVTCKWSYI